MILDLIACIPTNLIEASINGKNNGYDYNDLLRLLRLPRLYRLVRMIRIFKIIKVVKISHIYQRI